MRGPAKPAQALANLKDKFIICMAFLVELPLQKEERFGIMIVVIISK